MSMVSFISEGDKIAGPHQAVANYAHAVADTRQLDHVVMKDAPHSLVNEQLSGEYVDLLTSWAKQLLS